MEVIVGSSSLTEASRPGLDAPVCAIGNFDGVHVGHQKLIALARARAAARGATTAILTFDPHPAKVLAPRLAPPLICTPARKRELLAALGVDLLWLERFDEHTAAQSAESFVTATLVGSLRAREVVVGYDFTYGQGRTGNAATLIEAGRAHGFDVHVLPQVTVDGLVASSTKIRELLLEGNVAGARLLLGRDFDVDGTVVRGAGRGRAIGVPTANVAVENELLPRLGIYATRVSIDGGPWQAAATSLGTNPTFGGGQLSLEAHLIDWSGDLYGKRIRVAFVAWLRGEERFASVETLVAQIRADIAKARTALEAS